MIIGVLGGIGPEATGLFYDKLIKKFQDSGFIKNNTDYPQIIINSIPAPELIYKNISENDLLPYIKGLKELESFGVDYIVIVCNTIYLYYNKLKMEVKIPIINLRDELKNKLIKEHIKSVFIIGTNDVLKHQLYNFEGINCLIPTNSEIKLLEKTIFNFNKGYKKNEQSFKVKKICEKYLSKGIDKVILGCTEFAVMLKNEIIPKIDTIDVLVNSTIERLKYKYLK